MLKLLKLQMKKNATFTEFCNNRSLVPSSIILYRISLNKYIMFIVTLGELINVRELRKTYIILIGNLKVLSVY